MACASVGVFVSACGDPVADATIAALGGEAPGVPVGPSHRPGQPCLACHGASGKAQPQFSVAGTIYKEKGKPAVLGHADVSLRDAAGRTHVAKSNCAGNFYVRPSEFAPSGLFWVSVSYAGESIDMDSPVYREGSCATCHSEPLGPQSAGSVYLTDEPETAAALPEATCKD